MANPVFGTAHLFGLVPGTESTALLRAAWEAGFRYFDTAPSYGHGRSESALGSFLAEVRGTAVVTTKVGIAPVGPAPAPLRLAKAAARRLPAPVRDRLRAGRGAAGHGHFEPQQVRASVETSLRRLGRIDRLLLHEAMPADITAELLDCLADYRQRGDVGLLGVATSNTSTAACLRQGRGGFDVAHVSVAPLTEPPVLLQRPAVLVGHGALGPGGADLRRIAARQARDPGLSAAWQLQVAGTWWSGAAALGAALLARTTGLGVDDVIVASSRPERLPALRELVAGEVPLPAAVSAVLEQLIAGA